MIERIGKYEILERIATGEQGTVYRALDPDLDRVVAIKIITQPVTDDPLYLEALQREARLASSLNHVNITTHFDFQVEGDNAFIVMEYVPDSLDKHIDPQNPIPHERASQIARQISQALAYAHDNSVVHRDIKPANILLTSEGNVKVSDFGIARALASSTRSRTTNTMGTPSYMSPEQWLGVRVDGRADVYSLGILLYEMLTGEVPFKGEVIEALYVQHRESPIPALPEQLNIPQSLQDVINISTAKNPDDRFPDAHAMAEALDAVLSGQSITVPVPPV